MSKFKRMQQLAFGKTISNPVPLTESKLPEKIKEMVMSALSEKKKPKKEADTLEPETEESIPTETSTEVPADTLEPSSPADGADIDPQVKAIQDALQKAYAGAKALGDEKLTNQIGNTITMLVRTQVLGGQQGV